MLRKDNERPSSLWCPVHSDLIANGFNPSVCERFEENPVGSGFSYPVIRSVSTAAEPRVVSVPAGYARDVYQRNKARLDSYLDALLSPVRSRLRQLNETKRRIGIFGAGPHTIDLLGLLARDHTFFVSIFNNNPNKHGENMRGIPIVKPERASLMSVDCILISSAQFEKVMVTEVRAAVGKRVEIITIYSNDTID